jgi:plastocyanin
MRKLLVLLACLTAVGAVLPTGAGATVTAKKKAPVKVSGKVNNHGTKSAKGGSIEIEQDDFYFGPTFVKAKPGTTLTVELKNEGQAEHNFSVTGQNIDQNVEPGQSVTVTVDVPASGNLLFFCKFHQSLGMQGSIFTKAGTAAKAKSKTKTTTSKPSSGYGY